MYLSKIKRMNKNGGFLLSVEERVLLSVEERSLLSVEERVLLSRSYDPPCFICIYFVHICFRMVLRSLDKIDWVRDCYRIGI